MSKDLIFTGDGGSMAPSLFKFTAEILKFTFQSPLISKMIYIKNALTGQNKKNKKQNSEHTVD